MADAESVEALEGPLRRARLLSGAEELVRGVQAVVQPVAEHALAQAHAVVALERPGDQGVGRRT